MNTMRKWIGLWILLGVVNMAQAQQRMPFGQQLQQPLLLNPAAAGWEDFIEVSSGYRKQWAGLPEGPEGYYLAVNGALNYHEPKGNALPMFSKHAQRNASAPKQATAWYRHGFGVVAMVERMRPMKMNSVEASYGFHFKVGRMTKLALGARFGVRQWRANADDLYAQQEGDPALGSSFMSSIVPVAGVGALLYGERFYLSLAVAQAVARPVDLAGQALSGGSLDLAMHGYFAAGYRLSLHPQWEAVPQLLLHYANPVSPLLEGGMRVQYLGKGWLSLGYRSSGAMTAGVGIWARPWLLMAYSYDASLAQQQALGNNSHEISLRVRIAVRQYGLDAKYF